MTSVANDSAGKVAGCNLMMYDSTAPRLEGYKYDKLK